MGELKFGSIACTLVCMRVCARVCGGKWGGGRGLQVAYTVIEWRVVGGSIVFVDSDDLI